MLILLPRHFRLTLLCIFASLFSHAQSIRLNEILASNQSILADEAGEFDDWVEVYNGSDEVVNLSGFYISDNAANPQKWQIPGDYPPATTIQPGGFLLFWLDDEPQEGPTHLPFKINAAGEDLLISAPDGTLLDLISFGQQAADISLSRLPDGTGDWIICPSPTPGASNSTSTALPLTDTPQASVTSGRYDAPFQLSFTSSTPGAQIRLRFDGAIPGESDSLFTQPIDIQLNTVVRARVFAPDYLPGGVSAHSYLLVAPHSFPIVSLVFDPHDFFDSLSGIYSNPLTLAELEVPVHATWMEPDGQIGFSVDVGAELFGSGSLTLPQKSLLLKAKPAFGAQEIEYQVFPEIPQDKYKRLALRNSGQDWGITMFRDAFVGSLGRELGDVAPVVGSLPLVFQAFRPTVVYLNGQYWGIHNAREQHNKYFIAQHFDADEDEMDFIEFYGKAIEGDSIEWQRFWQWLSDNHFHSDLKFNELAQRNDMPNFTDYCIFQIASDNVDWPGKNWRRFLSHEPGARWHWLPYDFDLSFGLMNTDFSWNTGFAGQNAFSRAIDSSFTHWASSDWQTLVLRRSLENQSYRHYFLNRTADLLNTVFEKEHLLTRIDSFENLYLPEIDRHFERWFYSPGWLSYWRDNVQKMKNFAQSRADYCFEHVLETFPETAATAQITLAVEPQEAGKLDFSTLHFDTPQLPWQGRYFQGIPVPVKAVAKPGWTFSGWSLHDLGTADSISLMPTDNLALTAYFTSDSIPTGTDTAATFFQIMPNPAGQVTQVISTIPVRTFTLYNALGVKQQEYVFENGGVTSTLLNLESLPSGIYWLQAVFANARTAIRHLIKT